MKYSIAFSLAMILFLTRGKAQDIKWQYVKNWKIYKIPVRTGFTVSVDSLPCFKSIDLDAVKMKEFMNGVQPMAPGDYAWMGLYVASYEMNDQKRHKMLISTYGGFFFDEDSNRYFQIAKKLRDSWIQFLNEISKTIK